MNAKSLALFSALTVLAAFKAAAATVAITSDWNQLTTGTYAWGTASNWTSQTWIPASSTWSAPVTPGSVPNSTSTVDYAVRIINGGAGNIVVETGAAITVGQLYLSSTDTGSTTLKLGGDFRLDGSLTSTSPAPPSTGPNSRPSGISNTTSDPANLAIDLNGYTFLSPNTSGGAIGLGKNFTIRDSSAGGDGMFASRVLGGKGRVEVENAVTIRYTGNSLLDLRGESNSQTAGWNFSSASTLLLNVATSGANFYAGGKFGNITVGSTTNAAITRFNLQTNVRVQGSVLYNTATDGTGSLLSIGPFALYVAGNFTDLTTLAGTNYGNNASGAIIFNGGIVTPSLVGIARPGLNTNFQVGENASTPGSIRLTHDLATTLGVANTGKFTVLKESKVDLDIFTLQVHTADIQSSGGTSATLAYTFGDNSSALFKILSLLTLNDFNLELNYDGSSWTNGSDLLLFQYGTLSGTPDLGFVMAPGITHGGLFDDGAGNIYLQNVSVVPEPSGLLAVGLAFLAGTAVIRHRRRSTLTAEEERLLPHFLPILSAGLVLSPLGDTRAQENAAVFNFPAEAFPSPSLFQDDNREIVPRSEAGKVMLRKEIVDGRETGVAVLAPSEVEGKGGMRVKAFEDDPLFQEMTSLTVALFVRFDGFSRQAVLLERIRGSHSVPGYFGFYTGRTSTGIDSLFFWVTTQKGSHITKVPFILTNEWQHFAVVFDKGMVGFFLNGDPMAPPAPIDVDRISGLAGKTSFLALHGFNGAVTDLVAAPNRALTNEQISILAKKGSGSEEAVAFLK